MEKRVEIELLMVVKGDLTIRVLCLFEKRKILEEI